MKSTAPGGCDVERKTGWNKKHVAREALNALPGTHWEWNGEMKDGRKVTELVDDDTGKILSAEDVTERVRRYKKLIDLDAVGVELMMLEEKIKYAIKEAKEGAIDFHQKEGHSEEETDKYFEKLWDSNVKPLITRAEELMKIINGNNPDVPPKEEEEEEESNKVPI